MSDLGKFASTRNLLARTRDQWQHFLPAERPMTVANRRPKLESETADRMEAGKRLRDRIPRADHAIWKPSPRRADPVDVLKAGDVHRVRELIPIRYGRMLKSPFAFYRGSAAIMAADLATTPTTGIRVQACGDCHLVNLGGFATPERRLIFDVNDMDETLPAPWEWDVKR